MRNIGIQRENGLPLLPCKEKAGQRPPEPEMGADLPGFHYGPGFRQGSGTGDAGTGGGVAKMTRSDAEKARIRCIIQATNWKAAAEQCEQAGEPEGARIAGKIAAAFQAAIRDFDRIIHAATE